MDNVDAANYFLMGGLTLFLVIPLCILSLALLFGDVMSLIFPGLIKILSLYRRKGNKKNYFTHKFST